jgi:NTE family protein
MISGGGVPRARTKETKANMENDGHKRVAIACQGGGSHAAFTAGALKELLTKKRDEHEVVAFSGTSGGAVCALLAWYGLLTKCPQKAGREEAVRLLNRFWRKDMATNFPPERLVNEWLVGWRGWQERTGFTVEQSPYYFPELAKDRLKEAIENNVKFNKIDEGIVQPQSPQLFVGAVNAFTGEFWVFKSHKPDENCKPSDDGERSVVFNDGREYRISFEAILSSAAVPFLFRAVHTGEAAYWDSTTSEVPQTHIGDGVYWDGLYSQNPPIRDLTDADPHEIWVLQINPEEIAKEPTGAADIGDRRNELSGNISLNQELYFVRKINELVRRFGVYKNGEIKLRGGYGPDKREYRIIKVRRIELSLPTHLPPSSKLDRNPVFIDRLMDHGQEQASHFLETMPFQLAFEAAWESALGALRSDQDTDMAVKQEAVEAVMEFFADLAEIEVVPPLDSSARKLHCKGKEAIRGWVRWCLERNYNIEQTRDYRRAGKKTVWWMLATASHFATPSKGRIQIIKGRA